MIDASEFALSYNAFWHSYAPMSENLIRLINLAETVRFDAPIIEKTAPARRAVVAEYAFSIAVELLNRKRNVGAVSGAIDDIAKLETAKRMSAFQRVGLDVSQNYSDAEKSDANRLSSRMADFFSNRPGIFIARPSFKGCGFIDASEGDIINSDTLFEIKSVNRAFRSADLRQVLTYCALNWAACQFAIDRIAILNPKLGLCWEGDLDYACRQVAGRPKLDFFDKVIQAISSGEISR